ncbi:hypothetical protein AKJ52_00820 [candidate division MSBL1 archaeon SCGC-AAA382C18]|uniref:2Fe-2S ferredoxin-type domain-containing protein n=1 Tax=candidate division MSBL1 archaeon SCGC-AAA382C18 TaxID=1698281 RepID=A0A133VL55_9EURY|nr:hypothetical protein AKJ52_00820 [candidate division MSBL1 archaeon SCGC-AAA382C18]
MGNVKFYPWGKEGTFEKGTRIIDAAEELGIDIESPCGKEGLCGKCKVVVEKGYDKLSNMAGSEENLLSEKEIKKGYRLSCHAEIEGEPIEIKVPSESWRKGQEVLTSGQELEFEKNPAVQKHHLQISEPSLDDPLADYERVKKFLNQYYQVSGDQIDEKVQKDLPSLLREGRDSKKGIWDVTATLWKDREILDIEPEWNKNRYGMAVDIGTTTLAGYLLDLETGDTEAVSSIVNPQISFGEDLMTRISYIESHDNGREKMQNKIIEGVNELVEKARKEANVEKEQIYSMVLVGNTAMHHFFLGFDSQYLPRSPFPPARQSSVKVKAREMGIEINPSGYIYWLPVNAGWVGADNVAVMLTTRIYDQSETSLVIDIGTNGEIAVGNENGVLATSAAAGPAFEGAEIKYGMRAQDGSIENVEIDPETLEPIYETIGEDLPEGICGSGIIDAAAEMVKSGIVNRDGSFSKEVREYARVKKSENGVWEYVIAWKDEAAVDNDITVSQKDIREIQKAKGAIQAASRVLMERLGVEDIDNVQLAGAFGNYIDKESAMTIGIYPYCELDKVEPIGNAAGTGSKLALMSVEKMKEAEKIPEKVKFLEIAGTEEFRENYMDALYFPHKQLDLYPDVKEKID